MGNLFTQHQEQREPPQPQTSTDDAHIDDAITKSFSRSFPNVELKRDILADYYVSTPSIPFYEKNASDEMVIKKTNTDGNDVATYGDIYTGSSLQPQIFVDIGYNTYLPLNDTKTGDIFLQTNKPPTKIE
ncbi:MAG TPA: hypothetical protein EYO58_07215 [Flavobacteriales bacterium]|nr:hypothetical protein [Flavobacteriales bacterium]